MRKPLLKYCANCFLYDWPQAAQNKRCSECKIILYCTKKCQNEHWHKVHKFHCKILSGKEELHESKHDPSYCLICARKASSHLVTTSTEDHLKYEDENVLPCFWRSTKSIRFKFKDIYSPVVLGEVTGSFQSNVDHTVSTLCRITLKIRTVHKYRGVTDLDKFLVEMTKELQFMRGYVHVLSMIYPADTLPLHNFVLKLKTVTKIFIISSIIRSILSKKSLLDDESTSKLWYCFELLFNLLNCVIRKNMTVPDSYSNRNYIIITNADYNLRWSNILKSFDSNNWTYKEIFDLLIDYDYEGTSSLRLECFGCGYKVCDIKTFRCFDTWLKRAHVEPLEESVFFMSNVFSMGFISCNECLSSRRIIDVLNFDPNDIVDEMNVMTRKYRCDKG